ncbi:MAG: phage tail protein [Sphaerochaetaceae bacterium]|nr:phage tail protein [Sphaerochaetaceae bacterium]
MAQVGCLGDIVFQVSANTIKTIDKLQWSGSVRYSEHKRHLTNTLTEFTGIDPDIISFEIILSVYLGVDPMKELSKIWEYERNGKAVSLVIGEKAYGKYRWTIQQHKIKFETYDKSGNLTGATVSVDLLEYLKS